MGPTCDCVVVSMPSRDGQATACHDKDTLRPVWEDKDTCCDDKDTVCYDKDTGCDDKDTGCDDKDTGCDDKDTGCDDKDTRRVWEDKDTWRPVWDRCMKSGCVFAGLQSCQLAVCSPGCSHDHCHVLDAKRAQMFWRCVHGWQPRDLGPDPLKVLPPYATTTIPRVHCRLRWPDTSETTCYLAGQEPCAGNRAPGQRATTLTTNVSLLKHVFLGVRPP